MRRKRLIISGPILAGFWVVFFVLGFTTVAFSQAYPTKPVTLVCGMDPGGIVDVATRVLIEGARPAMGQDMLVENKPGGSHMVACSYVVNSKPDGYTLFTATDAPFVRMPNTMKLKYDPITETTPVIMYGLFTHFLLVPADSPFKTLKDMFVFAKQNPEKLTFGNPGFGTLPHINMAAAALQMGMKVTHVPFSGENKMIAAMLGGHLMASGISIESSIAQVQAGKLRALCIMQGDKRWSDFPDMPIFKEVAKDFGLNPKTLLAGGGLMIAGPKGLPDPVVKKLEDVFEFGRKSAVFQKYAKERYIFQDGMPLTGSALKAHLNDGFKDMADLTSKLGIKKK